MADAKELSTTDGPKPTDASFSLQAFNQMVFQFLENLRKVFKDDKKLRYVHKHFWSYVERDQSLPKQWFDSSIGQHGALIQNQDSQLFEVCPKVFHGIDMAHLWSQCTDENKGVVWKYIDWLHRYSTVLNVIPPENLAQIDGVVKKMMGQLEESGIENDGSGLDTSELLGTAMRMLSGLN